MKKNFAMLATSPYKKMGQRNEISDKSYEKQISVWREYTMAC